MFQGIMCLPGLPLYRFLWGINRVAFPRVSQTAVKECVYRLDYLLIWRLIRADGWLVGEGLTDSDRLRSAKSPLTEHQKQRSQQKRPAFFPVSRLLCCYGNNCCLSNHTPIWEQTFSAEKTLPSLWALCTPSLTKRLRSGSMQRGEGGGEERERRETRYLTDNVIIVSQSTGMREVRRGVAKFPYIWMGALSDGGQREIIIVVLRGRTVLTAARWQGAKGRKRGRVMEWRERCGKMRGIETRTQWKI